ncbi:MAG: NAD(P)H-dependent oxidoreductase [Treponemataceae bacterium]
MKITVLGGSPKGQTSVTMQYVAYLEKRYPEHEWSTLQIASRIALLEKNEEKLNEVMDALRAADLVLWAFPLYYMTVCSQYKRFIELIEERGHQSVFAGKYAASLSTSIHFYDHTAHVYIREISEDWGLRFVSFLSAEMNDMTRPQGRAQLDAFADDLFAVVSGAMACPRLSAPRPLSAKKRNSPSTLVPLPPPARRVASSKRTVVLVDYPETAIGFMARRYAQAIDGEVELIDLGSLGLEGGCLGCLRCGANNECAYTGKDTFIETLRTRVQTADIVVYAGTVRDRLLSARWKAFLDRSFCNTHQRSFTGKQFVFLVSGPLSTLSNLKETLSAYVELHKARLIEFVSDETDSPELLGALLDAAAARSVAAAELPTTTLATATFRGVGGMKIFRDAVYAGLRIVFKADHRSYKRNGEYDFPTKKVFQRFGVWLAYWITSIPFIQKGMNENMKTFMLKPYEKVLEKTKAKSA